MLMATVSFRLHGYYVVKRVLRNAKLGTQWIELKVGFWATFLIALCFYVSALIVLVIGRKKYGMFIVTST